MDKRLPEDIENLLEKRFAVLIQPSVLQRIINWNRVRNGLEFDPNLEVRMLTEEAHEFFHAECLEEQIREFADFMFVLTGTIAKFYSTKYDSAILLTQNFQHFNMLMEWAAQVRAEMFDTMLSTIEETVDVDGEIAEDMLKLIVGQALEIITEANEKKGTEKDEHGKIVKGPDYVAPDGLIKGMVWDVLRRKYEYES